MRTTTLRGTLALVLSLGTLGGCASGAAGGGAGGGASAGTMQAGGARVAPTRGSSTLITEAELRASDAINLRQAIERLRPAMLRQRGSLSVRNQRAGVPTVYVDDQRMGGLEALADIRTSEVAEVRYLDPGQATGRYGVGNEGGVIAVRTKGH